MAGKWTRRAVLLGTGAIVLKTGGLFAAEQDVADVVGQPLRPWRRGWLDIHHIATGRGDSTLILGPDGTSQMIDAGASADTPQVSLDIKPNGQRRPGEWLGRYALRHLQPTGRTTLDYLLVTHLHPDHIGDVTASSPQAADGDYRLTGVSDVAAMLQIGAIVDRGYPDYSYPRPWTAPFATNYFAFLRARERAGGQVERFRVGSVDQFALRHEPGDFTTFTVRNLAANGEVWTGRDEETRQHFPAINTLAPNDIPDENACSAAVHLRYGRFGYFTAGDLTSNTFDGTLPWRDVGTLAAQRAGCVDVAVAPHHGMFDATGADAVRALRPRSGSSRSGMWPIPASPAWSGCSARDSTTVRAMYSPRASPGKMLWSMDD